MPPQVRDKADLILSRIERYGLALCLLVALLFWMRPKLDRAFDKHMEFMDTTEAVQKQNAETLETQAETGRRQTEISAGTRDLVNRINGKVDETHGMVRKIHERLQGPAVGHAEPEVREDECR